MRAVFAALFIIVFCPIGAMAQGSAPPPASPPAPSTSRGAGDITRDEYIERAKRNAEKRFDRMDIDHDGVLTPDERRAARAKRHAAKPQ